MRGQGRIHVQVFELHARLQRWFFASQLCPLFRAVVATHAPPESTEPSTTRTPAFKRTCSLQAATPSSVRVPPPGRRIVRPTTCIHKCNSVITRNPCSRQHPQLESMERLYTGAFVVLVVALPCAWPASSDVSRTDAHQGGATSGAREEYCAAAGCDRSDEGARRCKHLTSWKCTEHNCTALNYQFFLTT